MKTNVKTMLLMIICTLLILLIGLSYAFFTLEIEGTGKDVIVSAGNLRLEYKDEAELKFDNAFPGDSITKVITVKNTGTLDASYSLYWKDLINTIENFELHVRLNCKSYANYGESTQTESGTCDNIYRAVPMSDVLTTGTIKNNISIKPNITHEYTITVTFDNKNYLQDYNKNKTFSGIIDLKESNLLTSIYCTTEGDIVEGTEYVNGQYTYRYMQEYVTNDSNDTNTWKSITNDGWGVTLTDKDSTDVANSKVCAYINGKPVVSMSHMFTYSKASSIDLSELDTSNVINFSSMFADIKVKSLDLSGFNTKNVTNMSGMFRNNGSISIDLSSFDTSNVTNMGGMFLGSQAKTIDLSNFDTSKVTDMRWMFYGTVNEILDLSSFDTSNVTNMIYMFTNSKAKIIDLSSFNTSKVTVMNDMFRSSQVSSLDLSNFDTSNVTNMDYMFKTCNNLKTIYVSDKFVTDKVINGNEMFLDSIKLVGGAGTAYDGTKIDKTYARIDGGTNSPGYFTKK